MLAEPRAIARSGILRCARNRLRNPKTNWRDCFTPFAM